MAGSYKDYYGSAGNFLNAAKVKEFKLEGKNLEIANVEPQEIGEKTKLVANLGENALVLNATNANIFGEAWGEDFKQWVGKTFSLIITKTNYQGALVDSIQVQPKGK